MSITVIKEGNHLRILSASEPIPDNTPFTLFTQGMAGWQAAQLQSAFKDEENWGDKLSALIIEEKR